MARPQVTGTQSHLSAWHGSWSFYDERWGDGGAYAQITWRTLTMAIAQPGAVAELRHSQESQGANDQVKSTMFFITL